MFIVDDMMTRHPHTLSPEHTLADAHTLMSAERFRHLPVVDDAQRLVGLVTQRDVLSAQASSLGKATNGDNEMNTPLSHFAHRQLVTVDPGASLRAAALTMLERKIGCLPVIKNQKLVGIITDSDFVAIASTLLEIQEETEPMEADE
ncbi:CBS domain-containing protein [Salinivibrio proteolyticus]|uniref:CBS domain-containing protein n=1 Tax=Salinivibrio proteolyticus TaxID=334715 RepID=UPI00098949F5|nr:CBS domain-containing protein [Salinivibrio proteolyticus]OOF30571.1 acetoin utilization protein AcuB [Salinivibrio proteolyticus]